MTGRSETSWTLIDAARTGDQRAIAALVEKYRAPIAAWARRAGLEHEAEDVGQEVFLRFFDGSALDQASRTRGRFRHLVLAVTKHVVGDRLRRGAAQKRGAGRVQPLGERDVAGATQDDDFDREWVRNLLERALDRLGREHPPYYEAVKQFLLEEKSQAEVALALGKKPGDVRNWVHRGRAKLVSYVREEIWHYSAREHYEEEVRFVARFLPLMSAAETAELPSAGPGDRTVELPAPDAQ